MSNIINIFSIPIYEHIPSETELKLVQEEIHASWPLILQDEFIRPKDWQDTVHTNLYYTSDSIKKFNLINLKKYIDKHVSKYLETTASIYKKSVFMQNSWFNITNNLEFQNFHKHQDSVVSGVYYFKTSGDDGDIVFQNPNPYVDLELFPTGFICQRTLKQKPKVGKLLLFPGWLGHMVEPNQTKESRISIAFNYVPLNIEVDS